jgi:fumarate reductase subunit D
LHVIELRKVVVGIFQLIERIHRGLLLLESDVPAQKLILIGYLGEKLFIEAYLLDKADNRLLLLVLKR